MQYSDFGTLLWVRCGYSFDKRLLRPDPGCARIRKTQHRLYAVGAPTKATAVRMTFTNGLGQSVTDIALVLTVLSSSEKMYFILTTEDPLEQMSQRKIRIGLECARDCRVNEAVN